MHIPVDTSRSRDPAPLDGAGIQRTTPQQEKFLQATPLLDFHHPTVVRLVRERRWNDLADDNKIGAVYTFVQNEIVFGYNESDRLAASSVLQDGYGQCNTKVTLLMALLRSVGIPCRLHGFLIDKSLQKGAVTGLFYALTPRYLLHSWVEVQYQGNWIPLEGCILDQKYLASLHQMFPLAEGTFCGYAVATASFQNPPVDWHGQATYIQKEGISTDYGTFASPDDFYQQEGSNLSGIRQFLFKHLVRQQMNAAIARIRNRGA